MKKYSIVLAAALLVAACAPKENVPVLSTSKVFSASFENLGTRTYSVGGKVLWVQDDAISLFDHDFDSAGGVEYSYAGETGAAIASFTTSELVPNPGSMPYVYAIYPYASWNAVWSDGTIYAYNDPSQYYILDDSFGFGSSSGMGGNTMAAVSEDDNLEFKNLCGFLNLKLYGDSSTPISSVKVQSNSGEYISGDVLVTLEPGQEPVITAYDGESYAWDEATVYFNYNPVTLSSSSDSPVNVWFALTPGTLAGGITVTVTGEDGRQFSVVNSNPLTIKRSVCTPTAPLQVVFPELVDDPVVMNYIQENLAGNYVLETEGYNNPGPYTDNWTISYDLTAYGNVNIVGTILGIDVSIAADFDVDSNTLTIPAFASSVGEDPEYGLPMYVIYADDEAYHYDTDVTLSLTGDHQLSVNHPNDYYFDLVFLYENGIYWVDDVYFNSITYVSGLSAPAAAPRASAKASGPRHGDTVVLPARISSSKEKISARRIAR